MQDKKVLKLYIAPIGTSGVREESASISLQEDYGIKSDKFAGKNLEQTVMIVGTKPYIMAKENRIDMPETALGENILLNFDPHKLEIGTQLVIGSAIIEITQSCTLCKHLLKYDKNLPKLILNHRGIYCKIVKSGIIQADDKVEIITPTKKAC